MFMHVRNGTAYLIRIINGFLYRDAFVSEFLFEATSRKVFHYIVNCVVGFKRLHYLDNVRMVQLAQILSLFLEFLTIVIKYATFAATGNRSSITSVDFFHEELFYGNKNMTIQCT